MELNFIGILFKEIIISDLILHFIHKSKEDLFTTLEQQFLQVKQLNLQENNQ